MNIRHAVILPALLASASVARAMPDDLFRLVRPDGRHELAVSLGAFQPTAKLGISGRAGEKGQRFGRLGYIVRTDYFYNLHPALALGMEGVYINRTGYEVRGLLANAESKIRGDSLLALVLMRLRAPGKGLRPYVVGGIGVHHTRLDMISVPSAGYVWSSDSSPMEKSTARGNASGWAGTGRVGLEYIFADGGGLALEGGYIRIMSARYPATDLGKTLGVTDILAAGDGLSVSLRLSVRMGSPMFGTRGP